MRATLSILLICAFVLLLQHASCKRKENNCSATRISLPALGLSHNNGLSCQNCHVYQGVGTGCFVVAGSVYKNNGIDPYTNGEIKLYTQPNAQGDDRGTIFIDARGNFYSTANIDFSIGLYPVLVDADGNKQFMQTPTTTGNCNSCHGDQNTRLEVP